jgi:hypothetical protein
MVEIPEQCMEVLNDRTAEKSITSKNVDDSNVHTIRVGSLCAPDNKTVVAGVVMMKVTSKNLEAMKQKGELVCLLAKKNQKVYEIKATVKDYVTSGPILENLNAKLKPVAVKAVWVFEPKEVWDKAAAQGAAKIA